MKRSLVAITAILLLLQYSCITDKNKYRETDIYEEYETENGFSVLHLPPVLFKVFLSISDDPVADSTEILDKIDVIKFMFFRESNSSISTNELKSSMDQKIKDYNYNLLTRITEKDNDVSIYIIEKEKIVYEVLVVVISDKEYFSMNLVGEFSQDEVMDVYKSINMQKIKEHEN